jgi:GT2 family glycosyltransferase
MVNIKERTFDFPLVTIIIVNYNSGNYLQPCIDAVAAQSFEYFEVVVIDNSSDDDSVVKIKLPDERFRIIKMASNIGFAAANNFAAKASSSNFIATLNPDTIASHDWLRSLIEMAQQRPEVSSVGSLQIQLSHPERLDGLGDVWHIAGLAWRAGEDYPVSDAPPDGEIFGACAAAALYRRTDFIALGGFDERFFCYCEDVDLSLRLRLSGKISMRASKAIIYHAGSGTTGRNSEFTLFYGNRNRIWTFVKNTPWHWLWILLPYHIAFNTMFLISAYRRGYASPILRGYVAALKGIAPFLNESRHLKPAISARALLPYVSWAPWAPIKREMRPK